MTPSIMLLTIAAMGLVTFALRLSLILLAGRIQIPVLIRRALAFVPPAVFAAIIFPDMLRPAGMLDLSWENPFLFSGLTAILTAYWSKNVVLTMVAGMLALWLVRWLVG